MKKVFLYAYDHVNLGDDLFIHLITKRYSNVRFFIWTSKMNKRTFRKVDNLKVIAADAIFMKMLDKLHKSIPLRLKNRYEKKADAVVYIGGSIFIEYGSWKDMLNWWEYEAICYSFYVLGANFGPYMHEEYREGLDCVFKKMKDVCFRDRYSKAEFKNNPMVRYAPDILFGYPIPQVPQKKGQIFVSVIDCIEKSGKSDSLCIKGEIYISKMASLFDCYVRDGFSIVLVSFCKAEGDENAILQILDQMGNEKKKMARILKYYGDNEDEILEALSESEYIIASRFHAAVLGIAAGKPVFPVVYSDKTLHILEDIGFEGNYIDIRNEDSYDYNYSRKNLDQNYILKAERLAEESKKHFLKLDEILR